MLREFLEILLVVVFVFAFSALAHFAFSGAASYLASFYFSRFGL